MREKREPLLVEKDGLRYVSQPRVEHTRSGQRWFWRCGKCLRGRLLLWSKDCRVCHAKVVK